MDITKLLPMVAFVGGGYATNDDIKAKVDQALTYPKVVAVQYEINNLSRMIYMDTLDGSQPAPDQFAAYINRSTLRKVGATRDNTKDFWGIPYKLAYDDGARKFTVSSAGPDMKFGTGDDIYGGYHY